MAGVGKVAEEVMELTGQLVHKFKDVALPCVDSSSKAYWASQLQGFADLTEDEVLNVLCFWCDMVDNTSFRNDVGALTQLTEKFFEVLGHETFNGDPFVKNTVAYGLGALAHALPKEAFAPYVERSVTLIKKITMRDDAFSPDEMEVTENAMGALAKIAYKHIDSGFVTEADLSGVFGFFPFKEDEMEAQVSH